MQIEAEEITAKILIIFVVSWKLMVTGTVKVNPRAKMDMMEAKVRYYDTDTEDIKWYL